MSAEDKELNAKVLKQVQQVADLSRSQKYVNALRVFLDDPPFACKNLETKRQASDELLRVLGMVKDSDIDMYVDEMSQEQADVLLKYVYKGFETGENAASLLKWHAALVTRHGIGSIVRAMQVKKTV